MGDCKTSEHASVERSSKSVVFCLRLMNNEYRHMTRLRELIKYGSESKINDKQSKLPSNRFRIDSM
jgi:hypothetical protein